MSESNSRQSTFKDRLIADIKTVVTDAEGLLHATADQAGEKVAGLRARLRENLKTVQGQLAAAEATFADNTAEAFREALQQISDSASEAAEATWEAAQESIQKAAAATKEAANKALDAIDEIAKKARDTIDK